MDLKEYLRILRQRWILILSLTAAGAILAHGYTLITTPKYEASAQLFVAVQGNDSVGDLNQGNAFAQSRVSSYVLLATSPKVLREAADALGIDTAEFAANVSASNPAKSVLIDINAVSTDPIQAADIANAVATALVALVSDVENANVAEPAAPTSGSAPVGLTKVQDATEPSAPFEPNATRNLAVGILLGLLIGIGSAILIEVLDTRLRGRQSIEKLTSASILGTFAAEPAGSEQLTLNSTESYSRRAENYRQLRTHLQFANVDGGTRSVLVTSSIPGEGKSTTAANLALALAESGVKVLLVDADLRRPRQDQMFGLEGSVGLTTVLTGRVTLDEAAQSIGGAGSLSVLTSGVLPPNPSELLGSAAMERTLAQMQAQYDVVVIDTPPLVHVSDPTVLASIVSGVLLVSSADGMLHRDQLRQSLESLSFVKAKLLGLVLNRVESARNDQSYYDYSPASLAAADGQHAAPSSRRARSKAVARGASRSR